MPANYRRYLLCSGRQKWLIHGTSRCWAGLWAPKIQRCTPEQLRSARQSLRSSLFRLKSCAPMYIATKTPRKLDRKRSKLLRSKVKAKNRGRREGLKK